GFIICGYKTHGICSFNTKFKRSIWQSEITFHWHKHILKSTKKRLRFKKNAMLILFFLKASKISGIQIKKPTTETMNT
ncbi:hypothetical protein, partial [Salmonella enterica]|uniref:hypothetical protein n=1 Tax=Salmonella enterica TaxID=28901 RepID=UPI001C3877BB